MSQQAWKRHWKWQISQRGTGQWTDSHLYGMIHGQAWQSWLGMGRLSISIYQLMALALHSRLLQWLLMVLKRMALVLPFIGRRCSDDESGVLHFRKIWHHGKISYFSSQSKLKYHVKNLCLVIYMKLLKSTAPFEKMLQLERRQVRRIGKSTKMTPWQLACFLFGAFRVVTKKPEDEIATCSKNDQI